MPICSGSSGPLVIAGSLGPQLAAHIRSEPPSPLARIAARLAEPAAQPAVTLALGIMAAISLPLLAHPIIRSDDPATPSSALAAAARLRVSGHVLNSRGVRRLSRLSRRADLYRRAHRAVWQRVSRPLCRRGERRRGRVAQSARPLGRALDFARRRISRLSDCSTVCRAGGASTPTRGPLFTGATARRRTNRSADPAPPSLNQPAFQSH